MKPNKGASRTPSSGLSRPECVPGTGCFGGASNASSLSYLAEPPSFSTVSDPNLVVSLKNVMKKDSTTKTKALEDLVHYVLAHPFGEGAGVEEALLEIWAQLYPRLSVDSSRRVRKLSHGLQLQLIKSARKRMERYIPRIVGPWLSGLYDRDRAVVRTAQDSLSLFLNTHERIVMFWSKCQSYILDYAIEAAQETQDTLSDDRTTSAEDSEAKYHRVMAASLSLVLGLLQSDTNVVEKSREKLDIFFAQDTVWKSVTFRDSQVRKTTCQVLLTCLDRHLSYAQSTKVKQAFVTGGLKITQSGSALEYVQALTKLTQHDPALWAADTSKKKPPLLRLGVFIAKGSQGSPANYWECLNELLASLPKEKWTLEDASRLLTSIKTGITNRDEPRSNASLSWQCYVDATQQCLNVLSDENKLALTKQHLLPLFEQSLFFPSEKLVSLPPGSSAPSSILANVHFGLVQASSCLAKAIAEEWNRLGVILSKEIAASSSEASTEFGAAQLRIAEKSRRWFGFVGLLHGDPKRVVSISDCTTGPSEKVILQCITLLKNRDLKLEGAALALDHALRTASHLFAAETGQELVRFLASTASDGMEKLAEPASSHGLFSCLDMLGTVPSLREKYENIWQLWTQSALGLSPQLLRNKALSRLLSQDKASLLAIKNQRLQEEILTLANTFVCSDETKLKESVVDVLQTAVSSQALTVDTSQKIVRDMVALLQSETACTESILTVLEILARRQPNLLSSLEAIHTDLVSRLLSLTETTGEIKASLNAARIRSLLGSQGGDALPVIEIIRANLDRAGPQSLEIGTLAMQAQKAIENSVPRENVLPNTKLWLMQLAPLLERPVSSHLSVTSAIGGAVTLARTKSTSQAHMSRDRQGRSIPARMALYTQRVLSAAPGDANLPSQLHAELLHLQCVSMQLASDEVACLGKDGLWSLLDEASVVEAEEFVSASRDMVTRFVASALSERDKASETRLWSIFVGLLQLLMTEAEELTPRGVYSARALAEVIQAAMEIQGATRALEELLPGPENLKSSSKTALVAAGLISGFGESLRSSKAINNFSNRLVSDVAVLSPADDRSRMTLVLLTCCAQIYETGEFPIAKNRVVFAVKQMISWTEEPDNLDADFCAEICRALTYLLPCIKDVYGPQWEKSLRFCAGLWQNASRKMLAEISPWIHASLKLWRTLEELKDANDDLEDALKDLSASKYHGLVELMRIPREQGPQAMDIVDAMLYREVDKIPVASLPESMELLPLVASASRDIQTAAFTMLHKKIPAQQEELSIRVILDKTNAQLPDELLSLLLNPPMAEQYSDEALVQFPMPIRCYLLSWKLVFDAFSASSDKVCQDLTEHVKKGGLVKPLLDLLVGVLGHTAGQPLKLDKEKMGPETICTYDVRLAEAETSERSMHWLLAHLYYLTLRHVPGLFKAWYTDCRSKQTRMAVEAWTAKYFSPLVVADALDKVQQWASAQEPAAGGDDKELIIKVSKTVGEVTAGYEVDESQATIAIRPAADYPIGGVAVVGLRRVAVTERKWQSWIMTTQGAIAFSHGSIVAGLQVFQRNVVGALKGQSECAICYSIISTDQRMPDKRCSTCKNTFHRTCLYRWFQTSNQNTCPLCRNPIDYLGADTAKRKQG